MRLSIAILLVAGAASAQDQFQRGETLFTDVASGCGGCHALKGKGTAVGPDLSGIARLSPQAIAMAVRSTATQYVVAVKLKSGQTFPGMPGPKSDTELQFFDLSKTPPELQKVPKADVTSMTNTDTWKHPVAKIESDKLADIVAWIKYAVTGAKKKVTADEVE